MNKIFENNQVTIMGEIVSNFSYSHEIYGEGFYMVYVRCNRLSESCDIIPVTVSERLMNVTKDYRGKLVCVNGSFRSYNRHDEYKNRLVLSVFASEISFIDEIEDNYKANQIYLDGYICKQPVYRKTPLGREIADLLLAINRPYGKSDYIPCICWGRNARYASELSVGRHMKVLGRVQSREYRKPLADNTLETRTAYEVSVERLEESEDAKDEK